MVDVSLAQQDSYASAEDKELLAALAAGPTGTEAARVLREIARRIDDWEPDLREALCATVLDQGLFCELAHSENPDSPDSPLGPVGLYHWAVAPLAARPWVSRRLEALLPSLCTSPDAPVRTAARRILEDGELPRMREEVWRAVLRAEHGRPAEPAPAGPSEGSADPLLDSFQVPSVRAAPGRSAAGRPAQGAAGRRGAGRPAGQPWVAPDQPWMILIGLASAAFLLVVLIILLLLL